MNHTELSKDQLAAAQWARDILSLNPLVLDTETTGLDQRAEVCQIAVIDTAGAIHMNTLVKPSNPIPPAATFIHGLDNDHVKNARPWRDLYAAFFDLINGREVIIYNADYDIRVINQTHRLAGRLNDAWVVTANWHCAMLQYAQFWGDWNEYRGSWAWQTLDRATRQQGIADIDAPAHSAVGDCERTLAVIKAMAAAGEAVTP